MLWWDELSLLSVWFSASSVLPASSSEVGFPIYATEWLLPAPQFPTFVSCQANNGSQQVPLVKPQTLARTESSLETLRFLAGTGGDGRWELCCSLCWPCLQCFSQLGAGKQASCLPSAPVLQGWFYSIRRYMVAF